MQIKGVTVLSALAGFFAGVSFATGLSKKVVVPIRRQSEKILQYYKILDHWLLLQQKGISLTDYFVEHGYQKIAIYGMKELGQRLLMELKGTEIEIVCAIDQDAKEIYCEVPVVAPKEKIPEIDALVVTASYYFESIKSDIGRSVGCPMINLEDVVLETQKNIEKI